MRPIVIGMLQLPPIIEEGVTAIVGRMPRFSCTLHRMDVSNVAQKIDLLRPAVIISDPLTIDAATIGRLRSGEHPCPKFIAIQHCTLPMTTLSLFDATVSLYESATALPTAIDKMIHSKSDESGDDSRSLSQREKDVVIGIAKGLSNKEIASQMHVSVNTVMTHRRNISAKLKIHSAAGITIYAIVSKLIKLDDIKSQLP